LIEIADRDFLFLLMVQQIVCDGWSLQILIRELCKFYDAAAERRQLSLTPLPIQYADFAVWQRKLFQRNLMDSQLSYWTRQFTGTLPIADLPTDAPRPPIQSFGGARRHFEIPERLANKLKQLSRGTGVTAFIALLATYRIFLYRYTGQPEITIGFPIATRNWPETNDLIGPLVNTLVLRSQLSETVSSKELMLQIGNQCFQAYENQDFPFEKLVEKLQPERDLSHNPLFQVMFIFQTAPLELLTLSGINAESLDIDAGTSKFDLTLSLAEEA